MGRLRWVLVVASGVALVGCSGAKPLSPPPTGTSVAASSLPTASATTPSTSGSAAPSPSSAPATTPPPTTPPTLQPTTLAPTATTPPPSPGPSAPVTVQDAAFLDQMRTLGVKVTDEQATVTQGHTVCAQFGRDLRYDQVANSISGYNPDDARNLITAAVLTLCPQYKNLVGN